MHVSGELLMFNVNFHTWYWRLFIYFWCMLSWAMQIFTFRLLWRAFYQCRQILVGVLHSRGVNGFCWKPVYRWICGAVCFELSSWRVVAWPWFCVSLSKLKIFPHADFIHWASSLVREMRSSGKNFFCLHVVCRKAPGEFMICVMELLE